MKPIRTAITIYSLHPYLRDGRMTVRSFIEYAARIGARGVDLGYFWQDEEKESEEALRVLNDHGLVLSGYIVGNNFALAGDPEMRRAEMDKTKRAAEAAARMGAPNLRVFAGAREGLTWEEGRERIAECFRELTEFASPLGVRIALEDHHGLAASADHLLWYRERVDHPDFGFNVDIGNFVFGGDDCVEACRRTAPWAIHTHVKDFILEEGKPPRACAVGEGDIDAEACIRALIDSGYDGYYSIEFEGAEDAKVGVEKSLRFLDEVLRRAGDAAEG